MFGTLLRLAGIDLKAKIRAITLTVGLAVAGAVTAMITAGFAIALLYVWLQHNFGTVEALAIVAGGFALVTIVLFTIAFARPGQRSKRVTEPPAAAADNAPDRADAAAKSGLGFGTLGVEKAMAYGEKVVDDAVGAVENGPRQSRLIALALAGLAGIILGRRL